MALSTLEDGKKVEALLICTRIKLMAASMESDFKYCIKNRKMKWKKKYVQITNKKTRKQSHPWWLIFTTASSKTIKGKATA
jgi:hypothetical protein